MHDEKEAGLTLHRKHLGRPSWSRLRREARKRKTLRLLKSYSKQHLADGRKQLAVYAYDLIGHRINLDGVYELESLDLLFEWLAAVGREKFAAGCAVDIGANIGNHSVYFAPHFRKVFSFEPNPRTFRLLQLNAALADNIVCFNVGISSDDRNGLLAVGHHNTGISKVATTASPDTVPVRLQRLDSCIGDVGNEPVRLIKIDVEGHEEQVLLGSESVIRKHWPLIVFEQHRKDFSGGTTPSIEILKRYGYRNFAVLETFPPKLMFLPRVIRRLCQSVLRLVLGERREIRLRTSFEPQFYAFIVAVPDWALKRD